jgi:hypothetical protein
MRRKSGCGNCRWLGVCRDEWMDYVFQLGIQTVKDMIGLDIMDPWHADSFVCTNRKSRNCGMDVLEGSRCKRWERHHHPLIERPRVMKPNVARPCEDDEEIPF